MSKPNDKTFVDASQKALDKQVNAQSPEITHRLAQARKQALEQQQSSSDPTQLWVSSLQRSMFPTGIAMAALVLLILWLPINEDTQELVQDNLLSLETLDLLSAEEDLDLYEELEFINWLSLQAEQG
ncbi:hypothetical protein ACMXYV_11085 [Neptuniibacter sp. SY11_33]|uniref:hypothetical protein n=1 Tax=Neptuniibacter sp. SY11_33 TaxID=3398215 RepID=UPI0039F478EC